MITIYGDVYSGNCYKVKLVAEQLDYRYDWRAIDILQGETKTAEFQAINPAGKIPVMVTDEGRVLAESNAIIWYLAQETPLLPQDSFAQAEILQWLFFEQYMHEPPVAGARFIKRYLGNPEEKKAELAEKIQKGYQALDVMETHLHHHDFFVSAHYSIADIALFAYTHVAGEGGFSLDAYPHIRSWIKRISNQERFVPLG